MVCPKCKASLRKTLFRGIKIDVCDKCRGIWFDRGEFGQFRGLVAADGADRPKDYFSEAASRSTFADDERSGLCPRCRYNLYPIDNRGLVLDFCTNCQGVWFDGDEIKVAARRIKAGEKLKIEPRLDTTPDDDLHLILHVIAKGFPS